MEYTKEDHNAIFKCGIVEHIKEFIETYAKNNNKTVLELSLEDVDMYEMFKICKNIEDNLGDLKKLMETKGLLPNK